MIPYVFNLVGLFFDIIGVILLFKFGLPSEVTRNGITDYVEGAPDGEEAKKWKRYKCWANIALTLLLLGFSFQVTSTVLFMAAKNSPPRSNSQ